MKQIWVDKKKVQGLKGTIIESWGMKQTLWNGYLQMSITKAYFEITDAYKTKSV